ncbi:glycoside hydrolase family 27 protein [Karstenula rhodostoma CBS 690.94]|uniref:Alpha-galactosidase n=1 Tax=Karstenula rhodostoma CBS 690.94 TaxID=1392251 RepID=A0A9P4UAC6_9PLEO|nr:glycoside hydrolase family 27 protein [Karstenula rhodostoma CBS 690.94]
MLLKLLTDLTLITSGAALVLQDNVGKLPALGWNSWNAYHCDITEDQFLSAANEFVHLGLKDAGYQYVNIDDCWSDKDKRDESTNRLLPNLTRFPDGIKGTAHKVHELGLKIGIYSSAGTQTCAGYPASIGFESIDAATWSEWGIDYLKYDNCNVPSNWSDSCNDCVPDSMHRDDLVNGTCTNTNGLCPPGYDFSTSNTAERFRIMRDALLAQNRTILYSLCEWGEAGVQTWGNATGSSWRTSGDIDPTWQSVLAYLNQNSFYLNYVDFWGRIDPDMLEVGNGLTIQEARTHFALWAAMKSPLLIGTDLAKLDQNNIDVLKNKYLLAFNQDEVYGKPATPYKWGTNPDWTFNATFPAEYWSGSSSNGTLVLLFNPFDDTRTKTANFEEVPNLVGGARYSAIDIWTGGDLGCVDSLQAEVEGHDTAGWLVGTKCERETHVSEM